MSANKYGHLNPEILRGVADIMEALEHAGSVATEVFVGGRLALLHADGWRIGWAVHYEDWWYFEPDYGDPTDHWDASSDYEVSNEETS